MGRLIDESEAIELIKGSDELTDYQKDECITCIRACNTAYDPDKVIEQLEKVEEIMTSPVSQDCFGEECKASDCTVCLIDKAIEIVKGGGVDA